jgi:hypothetical protein
MEGDEMITCKKSNKDMSMIIQSCAKVTRDNFDFSNLFVGHINGQRLHFHPKSSKMKKHTKIWLRFGRWSCLQRYTQKTLWKKMITWRKKSTGDMKPYVRWQNKMAH